MKSPLPRGPLFADFFVVVFIALLFSGVGLQHVEAQDAQRLTTLITNQDLAGIRAAVTQEPALLTKPDSRTKLTPLFAAIHGGQPEVVDLFLELGAPTDARNPQRQTPLLFALTRRQPDIIKSVLAKTEDVNQRDGRQQSTSLMYAVMHRNGHPKLLDAIIEKGADINLKNSRKQTALHVACYYNNIEAAKAIIKAGADLDLQDNNSNTPMLAACTASPELVSAMLSKGADPKSTNRQGQTALHLACQASYPQSVWDSDLGFRTFEQLLSKFDDVDLKDKQKETPLAKAIYSQSSARVKSLIDRGADPNIETNGKRYGLQDRSLVSIAASFGDADSVEALVNGGAKVNIVNAQGQTPLHSVAANGGSVFGDPDEATIKRFTQTVEVLLAAKADPNTKNKDGQTPLALAASRDFFSAVELLVDKTDELNLELADGSLLHWAAKNGLAKTSKRLLAQSDGGDTVAAELDATNSVGQTPLQVAADNGNAEIVRLLIAKKAKLDHVDDDGSTALLIAATAGEAEVVAALLGAGADTAKLDSSGHSALHLAAWGGNPDVIKELLSQMKVSESITKSGYTPLHAAAWNGHGLAVAELLKGGADPNVADSDGWTPLHKAAYHGHAKAVKALVEKGADKSLKNGVEMTALELAKSNGKAKEVASLLE